MTQPSPKKQELRASEERFHQLVESVTDYAIFMLDGDGNVATWNAGAKKAKGYEADEIIGKHVSTFYTPEDRAVGKPARILDTVRREGRVEDEGWRVRKDGTRFWADVIITLLRDDAGVVIGFAKVTRDLTERRAAAEELRRSEERFRLLIESVGDYAIYMLDHTGRVTTWNLGAERMKGYAASEIIGRSFEVFFPEEDIRDGKPVRELAAAIKDGRFEDEGWRVRKDGTRFWANVVVTALRDGKSEPMGFAKITRDLTMRREAEAIERNLVREQAARTAAETVAQRAEESNRIKDEFLATVSHELRTPLNAMLGWAVIARGKAPPDLEPALGIIERNARAQSRIIEDVLDISRIVSGKLRLETNLVDLSSVAKLAVETVRPAADAKGVVLDVQLDSIDPIGGDAERLQQIIVNLLSNGIKFTPPNGKVSVRVGSDEKNVAVSVSDTGQGIDPSFLPRVFEPFCQADGSPTRRHGGLGLGLAIVKHLVQAHGGVIRASSGGAGTGATFTFELPLRKDQSSERPSETCMPTSARGARLDGLKVLVVDDDDDARSLVGEFLEQRGATIVAAGSATAALSTFESFCPDIVVSDIAMPGGDGYGLIRAIRSLPADRGGRTPAIAMTAYTRVKDGERVFAAGFQSHLGKPLDLQRLAIVIANLSGVTFDTQSQDGAATDGAAVNGHGHALSRPLV